MSERAGAIPTAPEPGAALRLLAPLTGGLALVAAAGLLPADAARTGLLLSAGVPMVTLNLVLVLALAGWCLLERARDPARASWDGRDALALLPGAIAFVALCWAVPGQMRVQADEYLILGTAIGLKLTGAPLVVDSGAFLPDGTVEIVYTHLDKRGLLLPILIRAASPGMVGPANGLGVNLALGALALLGLYALARGRANRWAGAAAVLLLLACPLFVWSVRSIGLEPVNLALVVWAAVVARWVQHCTRPLAPTLLLGAIGTLLAQGRYESLMLGLALLTWGAWRTGAHAGLARARWVLAAMPVFLLPALWQRAVPFSHGLEQLGLTEPFSLAYLPSHLLALAHVLVVPLPILPIAPLTTLGALALAYAGRARLVPALRALDWTVPVAAGLAAAIGVILWYAWGDLRNPQTARLGLPLYAMLAALAPAGLATLAARLPRAPVLVLAVSLVGVVWSARIALDDWLYRRHSEMAPALNAARDWFSTAYPGCRLGAVTTSGAYFLAHGVDAYATGMIEGYWGWARSLAQRAGTDALVFVDLTREGATVARMGAELQGAFLRAPLFDAPVSETVRLRLFAIDNPAEPLVPGRAGCPRAIPDAPAAP